MEQFLCYFNSDHIIMIIKSLYPYNYDYLNNMVINILDYNINNILLVSSLFALIFCMIGIIISFKILKSQNMLLKDKKTDKTDQKMDNQIINFNKNLLILSNIVFNCQKQLNKFKSLELIETRLKHQNTNYDFSINNLTDKMNILNEKISFLNEKITKNISQDDFENFAQNIEKKKKNIFNEYNKLYEDEIFEKFHNIKNDFVNEINDMKIKMKKNKYIITDIQKTLKKDKSNNVETTDTEISKLTEITELSELSKLSELSDNKINLTNTELSDINNSFITKKQLVEFSQSISEMFQTQYNTYHDIETKISNINDLIEEKSSTYITKKHLSKYNSNLTDQFNNHLKLIEKVSDDIHLLKSQIDLELENIKLDFHKQISKQIPNCEQSIIPIIVGYKYNHNGRSELYDKTLYANTNRTQLIINLLPNDYKISGANNYITNSPNDIMFGLSYFSVQPEQQIHYDLLEDSIAIMKNLTYLEINKLGKSKETKILNQYSVPFNIKTISDLPIETLILNGIWLKSINGIENMKYLKTLHLENQDLLDNISDILQYLPHIKCTIKNCPPLTIDNNLYKMSNVTFINT